MEVEVPEGGGGLPVVFRVRAGPRVTVASRGASTRPCRCPPSARRASCGCARASPTACATWRATATALLAAYRDGGYPQAEVTPRGALLRGRGASADVVLQVTPGAARGVDHMVVAGLDRTREEVVRRELPLKEGEPLGLQTACWRASAGWPPSASSSA